jgi:hypothetical protein
MSWRWLSGFKKYARCEALSAAPVELLRRAHAAKATATETRSGRERGLTVLFVRLVVVVITLTSDATAQKNLLRPRERTIVCENVTKQMRHVPSAITV